MTNELLSHPNKTLAQHLQGVLQNCRQFASDKHMGDEFNQVLDYCAVFHDLGKASTFFQDYIRTRTAAGGPTLSQKQRRLTNHARISAWWTFLLVREQLDSEEWALLACLVVLKHHGNMANIETMLKSQSPDEESDMLEISDAIDYDGFAKIVQQLGLDCSELSHTRFSGSIKEFYGPAMRKRRKKLNRNASPDVFLHTNLLFSMLLSADKGEVIFNGTVPARDFRSIPPTAVDQYKRTVFGDNKSGLNILREQVYDSAATNIIQHKNTAFLSINVPTGIGKTFTVFNAALKLRSVRPDLKKIVYCLPFTSVIDQNAEVFGRVIAEVSETKVSSDVLMLYHHLAERKYKPGPHAPEIDDQRAEYLIHAFESELSVTTFYQLLHGIFTGRNRETRKLHSFANSIIILDEVQSIPIKYWPLVRKTFQILAVKLNITFILVTATMPLIFDEAAGEIQELVDDKQLIFSKMNRIDLDCSLLAEKRRVSDFAEILQSDFQANPDKNFLVIVNTRAAARELYEEMGDRLLDSATTHSEIELFFLSTNVYPKERLRRIGQIRTENNTVRKAHAARKQILVISTQLVEAGVDIDLDIVYRDIAPLDSIFQACGRCNRNMREGFRGKVKLIQLVSEKDRSLAQLVYGKILIRKTLDIFEKSEHIIPEADFFSLSQRYLASLDGRIDQDVSEDIFEAMSKLQYDYAFNMNLWKEQHKQPDYPNFKPFELIESQDTTPFYIMHTDTEARELYQQYEELLHKEELDRFERARELKNLYRKMSQFIVNVPAHYADDVAEDSIGLQVIDENCQALPYDEETGIQYGNEQTGLAVL